MTARPAAGPPQPTSPAFRRAAAPARDRILAQSRFEASILLRNGEQLLVSLVLPVLALVGLVLSHAPSLGAGPRVDVATPGTLALAVLSTAFTGQAIATGFDRRYGVLRLLGVGPLGRTGLLGAKAVAVLIVEVVQGVLVAVVGLLLGWHPHWSGVPVAVLFGLVGTWAFVALALLLAGSVRAEGVLALANLVWVLLVVLGGVLVPRGQLPGAASTVVGALPSAALADGLRSALGHGGFDLPALLVLLGWGVAATALTRRTFRWSD